MGDKVTFQHTVDQTTAGTAVFRMQGRLRGWPECFEFQEAVRRQLTEHDQWVILDMAQVEHVDSTGVGILAAIYTSAQNTKRELILAGLTPRVQKILDVLWFLRLLRHEPSVEEAQTKLEKEAGATG